MGLSLFYGITGIGYFLLQISNPEDFDSVLFPIIKGNDAPKEKLIYEINRSGYLTKCFQVNYPYTFNALLTVAHEDFSDLVNNDNIQLRFKPCDFISQFISTFEKKLLPGKMQLIWDAFKFESAKLKIYSDSKSYSMNHIKCIVKFEERISLMNMEESELLNQSLVFDKDSKIITAKWNWGSLNRSGTDLSRILSEFLTTKPEKMKFLLSMTGNNEVVEDKIDTLGQLTRSIFQYPCKIYDAINKYIEAFEINSESDREKVIAYAKQNINYYIKKSLLGRI